MEREYTLAMNQAFFEAEIHRVERQIFKAELRIDAARRTGNAVPPSLVILLEALGNRDRALQAAAADVSLAASLEKPRIARHLRIIDAVRLPEAPLDRGIWKLSTIGSIAGLVLVAGARATRGRA